ncbi:MAG: TlyA family RNA methyltransferase [Phycisphaerae bacterium]|nr:TlyA family RNA methyltransferase [Phycisphaerae bacterium]
MSNSTDGPYVSRGGEKLAFALDRFALAVSGRTCADLGCNVGGFVDCLLRRNASRVYAVDTGYGALAWTLRRDERVVVLERTNALHVELPEPVSLVTIDVAWTRQHLILPQALTLLGPPADILTLIKPQYEAPADRLRRGVLPKERLQETLAEMTVRLARVGITLDATAECPLRGGRGNTEVWGWIRRSVS